MKTTIISIPVGQLKDNILVVRVGSNERPAGPQDIINVQNQLARDFKRF